ncbi:hypothetical protein [Clostridium sp. Marseille-Q7071]
MDEKIYIIDFEILEEKNIEEIFYKWVNSRKNTPLGFKEDVKLMEINAHYAPCYVCDLNVSADYNIKVQKRHGLRRGVSTLISKNEEFTTKDYTMFASKILHRYDMDQIAPFDFSRMSISGYEKKQGTKERFSQNYEECLQHYRGAILKKLEMFINSGLAKVNTKEMKKKFNNINSHEIIKTSSHEVLVPVWVCKYSYKYDTYYCLINGQNGKFYGRTPNKQFKGKIFIIIFITLLLLLGGMYIIYKF